MCALVTGVQTCALPISVRRKAGASGCARHGVCRITSDPLPSTLAPRNRVAPMKTPRRLEPLIEVGLIDDIGRATCRERRVSVRVDLCGRCIIKKKKIVTVSLYIQNK